MGTCVHLSLEGSTGNSPLGGGENGEAAVNLLILQMFVGKPCHQDLGRPWESELEGLFLASECPIQQGRQTNRQTV